MERRSARRDRRIAPTCIAALLLVAPTVAPTQNVSRSVAMASAPTRAAGADSIATLLKARVAQRKFEQTRRANLPVSDAYPSSRCDVRVGRFCYWHDEDFVPPAEPERTATERKRFLARLAEAGDRQPRDEWIAGQRVRYLVEDERAGEAVQVAVSCIRADSSVAASSNATIWCDALEGFARHANGEYAAAQQAYDRALAAMSPEERCRWTDIGALLEGDRAKRYRALRCEDRDAFERRFYALARPSHLVDANDLRTEMLSRQVMAHFERAARGAHDMVWGDDVQEIMLRYGWETKWSKRRPSMSDPSTVNVIGHEATPGFDFTPTDAAFADPARASSDGWDPRNATAYTRYAPRWAKALVAAPTQIALFRRGDSALVVAALDVRHDTLFRHDTIGAALALLADSSGDSAVIARVAGSSRVARVQARARWAPMLVAVEALDSSSQHAAWTRRGVMPPKDSAGATRAVSDVLLLESADSLPASLDEAASRARGTLRVSGDAKLGAFWELYRVASGDSAVRYTLTVRPRDQGLVRSLARRLGLAKANAPVRMQWEEPLAPDTVLPRALAIDLSMLPEGRYTMELMAENAGGRAVARREIEVVR